MTAIFVPLAVATAALAPVIVEVAYVRGAFDERAAILTAGALAGFAPLLFLTMANSVLTGAHNARQRGVFLMMMGFLDAILNAVFNVGLGLTIGVAGIALSTSLTMGVIQFIKAWRLGSLEKAFPLGALLVVSARALGASLIVAAPIALVAWNLPHGLGFADGPRVAGGSRDRRHGRLPGRQQADRARRAVDRGPHDAPLAAPTPPRPAMSAGRDAAAERVKLPHGRRRPRVLRVITRLAVERRVHPCHAGQPGPDPSRLGHAARPRPRPAGRAGDRSRRSPDVAMHRIDTLARPIDPIADVRTAASLLSVVRSFRPDIIHTHHSKAGLLGRSVAMLAGIPRVHTFHGHVFEGYFGPSARRRLIVTAERLLATRTSRLIALGPLQRDDLLVARDRAPGPLRDRPARAGPRALSAGWTEPPRDATSACRRTP